MRNVMLTLDDDTFLKAEQKAGSLQTTVGEVAADFLRTWAAEDAALEQARQFLADHFANPNWQFAIGAPDDRTLRNARR